MIFCQSIQINFLCHTVCVSYISVCVPILSFFVCVWINSLHLTLTNTYNPISTNWSEIETAKNRMNNPVWKDIYDSLLTYRRNLLKSDPLEFLTLPVNGEPYVTKNITAIQQPWCKNLSFNDILDKNGSLKKPEDYSVGKRPVFMKILLLKMYWESL